MNRFPYSYSLALTLASIVGIALLFPMIACSQDTEWLVFNTDNSGLPDNNVHALAIDDQGNKWIGTCDGLAKFDGENWSVYDTDTGNSRLSLNWVWAVAIDSQGNKWIGTDDGLAEFDGEHWTVYKTANSRLPSIHALAIDAQGNIWVAMSPPVYSSVLDGGLAKFDREEWTVCDADSFGLPSNLVRAIAVDKQENIWIGTWRGGLAKFDGVNCTVYMYNTDNSGVPLHENVNALAIDAQGNIWTVTTPSFLSSIACGNLAKFDGKDWTMYISDNCWLTDNHASALAIDARGNVWIGTWLGGLAKFDGKSWTVYNTGNSELPDNSVYALTIDSQGNVWIGTCEGLAVYREGGVITGVEVSRGAEIPSAFSLAQNFPNPFNPSTNIRFTVPEMYQGAHVKLTIYDLLGQKVRTLMDAHVEAGGMEATWDGKDAAGRDASSGVYFYELAIDGGKWTKTKKMVLLR